MRLLQASMGCERIDRLCAKTRACVYLFWRAAQSASANGKPAHEAGSERGQASVEYALVLFGLLAVFVACAVLWQALDEGLFVEHAIAGASHHMQGASVGAPVDVLLY